MESNLEKICMFVTEKKKKKSRLLASSGVEEKVNEQI